MKLLNTIEDILNFNKLNKLDINYVLFNDYKENNRLKWCTYNEWVECAKSYEDRNYLIQTLCFVSNNWYIKTILEYDWSEAYGFMQSEQCRRKWEIFYIPQKPLIHKLPIL